MQSGLNDSTLNSLLIRLDNFSMSTHSGFVQSAIASAIDQHAKQRVASDNNDDNNSKNNSNNNKNNNNNNNNNNDDKLRIERARAAQLLRQGLVQLDNATTTATETKTTTTSSSRSSSSSCPNDRLIRYCDLETLPNLPTRVPPINTTAHENYVALKLEKINRRQAKPVALPVLRAPNTPAPNPKVWC
jgi:hypothetical protein